MYTIGSSRFSRMQKVHQEHMQGLSRCEICPPNTYSGVSGSTDCIECAPDHHSFVGSKYCTPGFLVTKNSP